MMTLESQKMSESYITEEDRKNFESAVFLDYYVKGIKRNPNPPHGPSGALDFIPTHNLDRGKLLERDGEYYKQTDISAMWHGYKLALRSLPERQQNKASKDAVDKENPR